MADADSVGHDVAIIGLGCVLPGAHSVDAFRELLVSGRDARSPVPLERWDSSLETIPDARGGFLTNYAFDWKKYRIPPFQVTNANPLQFQLLDAADQALTHAGYANRDFDRGTVSVLAGAAFTNDFCADAHLGMRIPDIGHVVSHVLADRGVAPDDVAGLLEEYQKEFIRERPSGLDETGAYSSSTLASRVAKQLDLGGGAMSIDAGDASGLAVLSAATHLLRSGHSSMVVCVAGQRNLDLVRYHQLVRDGRLTGEAGSPGNVVPAEGAVAFVLKTLDDARRDGDPIQAILRAASVSADPKSAPAAHEQTRSAGFSQSGASAADVTLHEGFAPGDATPAPLHQQIGDLQGGSSFADLLRTILALHAGTSLSSSGTEQPLFGAEAHPGGLAEVSSVMTGGFAHGGGACWEVLVEGTASLPRRPDSAVQHAGNGVIDRPLAEQIVLRSAFEQTGHPRELLRLEDELTADLQLTPGQQSDLMARIAEAAGIPRETLEAPPTAPRRSQRLEDLVEMLLKQSQSQENQPQRR